MATVHNITELSAEFGTTPDHIERILYKYTDCGAWISWTDDTVTIGSIVEGSDAEFDQTFRFPVDFHSIEEWIEELEELTTEAWEEANGPLEDF